MALKRLRTGEMVQLSSPWITAGTEARKAILATPELAGLLPRVEAGHKALHDAQPVLDEPRLAKVRENAASLDLRHDEIVRGGYWLLTSLSWLTGDPETAESLLRLRDQLFPAGLDTAQKPYREEAGATEMLRTRLASDPAAKKQLKEIPVLKKNLGHFMDELIAVGQKLGETENERAQILTAVGPKDGAKLIAARNQWIRAVNAMLANAELAELDEATTRLVFGALRHADKAADRRKGAPEDTAADGTPAEDTAVAPPAPPTQ